MTDSASGICDLCERTVLRASLTSCGGFLALCPDCKTSPEIVQNAPGDPGTPADGSQCGSEALAARESPAERLRRAADLVEQRAAAASGPRWKPEYGYGHTWVQAVFVECDGDGCGHDALGHVDGTCAIGAMHADGDNQWAVLAGRQIAKPLAAWLCAEADDADLLDRGNLPGGSFDKATTVRALAVADVILGEVPR